ncbi:MAG: galactokinase, partial [Fimbriimonas ginsengisoli]|nr:galactokinase [Fimbriimonas ginsengisoli]
MNYDEATGWFEQIYGRAPEVVACAPGRVNLIGEHTDTSEGFVFPAAIERRLWFMAARSSASTSRVVSRELGEAEPFDFMTADPRSVAGWAGLVAGMARAIGIETGYAPPAFDAAVASFIPIGAGLASSAALCVGAGLALARLAGTELEPMRLALSAQRVENEFLGVACGVMDPISCALSREGSAMFLDTRSLEIRYAAIPDSLTIAICDTGVPRSLAKSAYN